MKNPIKELLGDDKYTELKKFVFGEGEQAPNDEAPAQEEKKKMGTATLEDGTVIQWEGELATGVAVEVLTEEGEAVPAPDGRHSVSDGTIVITENGIVTEILSSVEEMDESSKLLEEIQSSFEAFKTSIDERMKSYDQAMASQLDFNQSLFQSIEFLANKDEEQKELKDKFGVAKEVEKQFNRNASMLLEKLRKGSKFK
jgi:hypothetical protein